MYYFITIDYSLIITLITNTQYLPHYNSETFFSL